VTDEERADWFTRICVLIETASPSRTINCDETSWFLHRKGAPTWAELGCQSVQAKINGDEKDCITAVACVTAAGEKLPLVFLASGKTRHVDQSQIGAVEGHWRTHSESRWQTSETLQNDLMKFMRGWEKGQSVSYLIHLLHIEQIGLLFEMAVSLNAMSHIVKQIPGLKTVKGIPMERSRVMADENAIDGYCEHLTTFLPGIPRAFIVNIDESGFANYTDARPEIV
jgi:hypothetical protein